MAARNIPAPIFPIPPKEYDIRYMSELVRVFSLFIQQVQNPGEGRNTNITLTNVPTSATGLAKGTIYVDSSGFLKLTP